ncbi:hypothetical protein BP6252_07541 [Coleophoma cylindrospora]|uniref:Uncharacterized protein n=1 Tax=Coleophoma cylindrospora TaxID=1849047 RepID=A0A3D8RAN7_9HELO|nr:hypothetical protein BP6252_07541 [Coleophoma cylindrospora]
MVRFISDNREVDSTSSAQLEVIGAGLPRAATSSMQAAFEILGYTPCLHMAQIIPHTDRLQLLLDAAREEDREKRHKMVRTLMAGHQGLCDFPVFFFLSDLLDMYPDIKIVLNKRENSQVWLKSAWESLGFFFTWKFWLSGRLIRTDRLWYALNMECVKMTKTKYGVDNIWSEKAYDVYHKMVHEEAAKRGKEVLEFQPKEGWEPLCKFLGKPVPSEPFPRLNEKAAFAMVKRIFILRGVDSWTVLGAGIWGLWKLGMMARRRL